MSTTPVLRGYDQNKQLWNLCERLMVDIPREGERVVYFLQGHIEELNFSTKQECHHGIAHPNLPSQILCRVINIQPLVEPNTAEIYFGFTLIPDTESDPTVPDPIPPETQKHEIHSIWKMVMASITSTHGVPTFQQSPIPSSGMPNQNMHLAVLATASHAVMTGTMFTVYYKQRASQFVIRLNKYLEAVNNNVHVGMRFKMRFQREDSLETSFFGTIIGIGDFSPYWPESKWRMLKVKWEEPSMVPRPGRVSPWEIQPCMASVVGSASGLVAVKSKRFKPICIPFSASALVNSNKSSRMRVDGIQRTSPFLNDSSSFLSEPGKDKAGLNDSSSFLSEPEKDKASTSAAASFCNWICCCFK